MKTRTDLLILHDWMLGLGLTESEERVYALIYGYTHDGQNRYRATAGSIAEWLHCSERTAQRIVRGLEDKGLLAHEIISWSNGRIGGVMTEFWTIDPTEAAAPAGKEKITWKRRGVATRMSRGGNDTDVVTPYKGTTRNKYNSGCGGKNKRASARRTTTTTGFLFDEEILNIPHSERFFLDAWEKLLREPKWQGKTPGQLQQQLDIFAPCDPEVCCYSIELAIRRGWDFIEDPTKIMCEDMDKFYTFADQLHAREEEGRK